VVIDGLVRDVVARRVWKRRWLDRDEVPWLEFLEGFAEELRLPAHQARPVNVRLRCLEALLGANDSAGVVQLERYGRLWMWLGPLRLDPLFLELPYQLVRQTWFHGEITSEEAERRILNSRRGTYLVRFSTTNPGHYSITVMKRNAVSHFRVQHQPGCTFQLGRYETATLFELLEQAAKELGLVYPLTGSQFERVFSGEEIRETGYSSPELSPASASSGSSPFSSSSSSSAFAAFSSSSSSKSRSFSRFPFSS